MKNSESRKIDTKNSKIPTFKNTETIHDFCKKNKDMAPGLAKFGHQKMQEPHRGQGDGPPIFMNEKSDADERSKNILMENLESSLKTPEHCPYEGSDKNEDYKYDEDYEDDYSDDDDDGDNISNSDGQDVVSLLMFFFYIFFLNVFLNRFCLPMF